MLKLKHLTGMDNVFRNFDKNQLEIIIQNIKTRQDKMLLDR